MKRLACIKLMLLAVLLVGLTSCEDDQYEVESVFIGRAWTGDVGLDADNGEAVYSTFVFGTDGFGDEYQYYSRDGVPYKRFRFQWEWEDDFNRNLVLDYGKAGVSFMDNVRIVGSQMRGTFYLYDGARGFDFVLDME